MFLQLEKNAGVMSVFVPGQTVNWIGAAHPFQCKLGHEPIFAPSFSLPLRIADLADGWCRQRVCSRPFA
jgi:hypothetical protein